MTEITLQTFKTITDSNGKFDTWAEILDKGMQLLPMNTEILGTVLKAPQSVIGGNVTFDNIQTKDIGYLEDNLTNNNTLTQDKMIMRIYVDYYTSIEYSALDTMYAHDWSRILSETIAQMFYTKSDMQNAIAIEELYKVSLALGQFLIIPKGDQDIYIAGTQEIDNKAYLGLAKTLVKYIKDVRAKRTKFAKGIQKSQLQWVISEQFSLSLLTAKTYGFGASNDAYKDMEKLDEVGEILSQQFRTSMYLQRDIPMTEFKTPSGAVQNVGEGTGNRLKPFLFGKLLGILWFKESLAYFENHIPMREQPKTDSRTTTIMSFMWRANPAIKPVYARANTIFLSEMPTEPEYTTPNAVVVAARDYKKWADFQALRVELYKSQPSLYNRFWDADGKNAEIKDQDTLTAAITKNTIRWAGTPVSQSFTIEEEQEAKELLSLSEEEIKELPKDKQKLLKAFKKTL